MSSKRLRMETLESRVLPAVAAFRIDAPESVEVGDEITVAIESREYHPYASGLGGVAVDVHFDEDLLEVLAWDITDNLPLFQGATIQDGEIKNLRGACFPAFGSGRPIGNLAWEEFATVTFVAEAPGAVKLTMNQGGASITTVPASNLSAKHLDFGTATIEILPASIEIGPRLTDGTFVAAFCGPVHPSQIVGASCVEFCDQNTRDNFMSRKVDDKTPFAVGFAEWNSLYTAE